MSQNIGIEAIHFVLDELSIQGLTCGDPSNELVLCLHGWLDNAACFIPLMTELSGKRVIAIYWPGHGLSSHRSLDSHYHFVDYVYDLIKLFEYNEWSQITVIGHSMGAMIATAFTAAFPEKVSSLLLIDSLGLISADAKETTAQLRQGMQSRLKLNAKNKKFHQTEQSAIAARMAVSDLCYADAELIINRALRATSNGFEWRSDPRLRNISPYRFTALQAKQLVSDIAVPVLLIHGNKGLTAVKQAIDQFSPLIDCFQCYELLGGHHIHMEQAKQSAFLIASFLAEHDQHQEIKPKVTTIKGI